MPTPARSAIARVVVLSYPLARNSSVAASLIRLSLSALLRSRRPFRGRRTGGDDGVSILRVTALWRTRNRQPGIERRRPTENRLYQLNVQGERRNYRQRTIHQPTQLDRKLITLNYYRNVSQRIASSERTKTTAWEPRHGTKMRLLHLGR